MAEQDRGSNTEPDLPVMVDPAIETALTWARDCQENIDMASHDELEYITRHAIGTSNQRWRLFWRQPVIVTGRVRSPVVNIQELYDAAGNLALRGIPPTVPINSGYEEINHFIYEQECTSLGFIVDKEDIDIDGEVVATKPKIKLYFSRHVSVTTYDEDVPTTPKAPDQLVEPACHTEVGMVADMDEVTLKFPFDSLDYIRLKARECFAGNMDSLDYVRVSGAKTADKLLALRQEAIKVPDSLAQEDVTASSVEALQNYTNRFVLGWHRDDQEFVADIKNGACIFGANDNRLAHIEFNSSNRLMKLYGVRIRPQVTVIFEKDGPLVDPVKNKLEYRLVAKFMGESPSQDSSVIEIRLSDVRNLESLRDVHNA